MKIDVLPGPEEAAAHAARWIARRIRAAVSRRGVCRIALSGGSTPVPMFDELAAMDLPWSAVHIFQVDERVAPDGHADRNASKLTAHLIDPAPIPRGNVHLMPVTAKSLSRAASSYASAFADHPFDIVHLGMGDDGHTASWPPGDDVVESADPVAITDEFNGRVRMTMTPQVVNAGRSRVVEVIGTAKAEPLARWLLHDSALPIERVRRTNTTVIADAAAAALLPQGTPVE